MITILLTYDSVHNLHYSESQETDLIDFEIYNIVENKYLSLTLTYLLTDETLTF